MSVTLIPSSQLAFNRPLTQLVKRSLTITNPNSQPVGFKVKTTAPKIYCVRPNSGRIEPQESVEVQVLLLAMKEEPPTSVKCKDKFLVQSTFITPEKESMPLGEIWTVSEGDEEHRIHQHKVKVVWLPPEGMTVPEEQEEAEYPSVMSHGDDSRYESVRQVPSTNGFRHPPSAPHISITDAGQAADPGARPSERTPTPPQRTFSPAANYIIAHEVVPEEHGEYAPGPSPPSRPHSQPREPPVQRLVFTQPPSAPAYVPPVTPPPPSLPPPQSRLSPAPAGMPEDMRAKYVEAQAEIQRLRALLASMPEPATELRRRKPAADDDAVSAPGGPTEGEFGDQQLQLDGYSPQTVAVIAFAVFLFTYLFF